jgi:hypothetical protein
MPASQNVTSINTASAQVSAVMRALGTLELVSLGAQNGPIWVSITCRLSAFTATQMFCSVTAMYARLNGRLRGPFVGRGRRNAC